MPDAPKRQQPQNARTAGADLKLHLRVVRIRDRSYRLLTLRPGARAAFSTNHFHGTWHILSDPHGARVLARLLWFLAYQRAPDTLVAIYGETLRPTPFEAHVIYDCLEIVSRLLSKPTAPDNDALRFARESATRGCLLVEELLGRGRLRQIALAVEYLDWPAGIERKTLAEIAEMARDRS